MNDNRDISGNSQISLTSLSEDEKESSSDDEEYGFYGELSSYRRKLEAVESRSIGGKT